MSALETFFSQNDCFFPDPGDGGLINIIPFLRASKHLAEFFGLLGTAFIPVRSDIAGNVQKLTEFCEKSPGKFVYISDIVHAEAKDPDSIAIDALLWLYRALEFTMMILEGIVLETRSGTINDDIRPLCSKAYEQTLKNYHGWMVQKIFGIVMMACPWRKDLINTLALGVEGMEDEVVDQMEAALVNLRKNVRAICSLYSKHNLHSASKV